MLNKAKTMQGYKLHGKDGELGTVREFYFDDNHWTILYLVVDTGTWLTGRQVLISPYAVTSVQHEARYISVELTKWQIEQSPSLDSDKPVSRQFEEAYHDYYKFPVYWGGAFAWGPYSFIDRNQERREEPVRVPKEWDRNLLSTEDVTNHHIQALDGEVGYVEDFIIDDENWAIRYLIVSTNNWLPGKHVLLSTRWIQSVSWNEQKVFVGLTRDAIKNSPEFSAHSLLTREYEIGLHRHYDRHGYWLDDLEVVKSAL